MKRYKFNWAMLDRNGLINMLWEIYPAIVDKRLTADQIKKIISHHVKKFIPIRVSKRFDKSVERSWIYIGGTYYSDWDKEKKMCIEVTLAYNPLDKFLTLDKIKYKLMCKLFADVILHEIIHMRQYRRRKFKPIPDYESNAEMDELRQEQNYLGCTDEIDAYSFNIACELLDKFKGQKQLAVQYLGKKHNKGVLKSSSLKSYLKAFEYNHNHPIIKRLKKKTIRYLPHAEQGKPYRTKDWINR